MAGTRPLGLIDSNGSFFKSPFVMGQHIHPQHSRTGRLTKSIMMLS